MTKSSNQINPNISDQVRWFEIIAVIITGAGKFIFMDWLDWRLIYITTACLFWAFYIFKRHRDLPGILTYWGFTKNDFKATFKIILPFGLIGLITFFIIGYFQNTLILNWHILPLLILYPIWGTIQQFIIIALIAGNLRDMKKASFPKFAIIIITAIIFSIVHYPFLLLVIGTFLLAILYSIVYLKKKNLYILGLFHGWLGAFFFYTVLERDPFIEVFGNLFMN